ncbi:MAG: 50S ribosomal protein L10 [Candidatus Omnitrophica bacterium]|nr:50S ribosomal protein L10 [Candidatus Omnitrophota bacterium]
MSAETTKARLGQKVRAGLVRDLKGALQGADTVVVARIAKTPSRDLNRLRINLKEIQANLVLTKNSFSRLVFKDLGLSALEEHLQGTCGLSPIRGDVVRAARLLSDFAKDHEGFTLAGGVYRGKKISSQELAVLARLPSREVLLSQVFAGMKAPMSGLVGVLKGVERKLVGILHAITVSKGKGG